MENASGMVIILTVLIVSAFLLIIYKLAEFFTEFNRDTRYILLEMNRAADSDEYRYWRRELRCHYLCLIPFVTERNVMRLYHRLYHRSKHAEKNRSDGFSHLLAPSVIGACICAVCLCGASWAWFTASTSTGTAKIQAAAYTVSVSEQQEKAEITETAGVFTVKFPSSGEYTILLKPTGNATTGYCSITVDGKTYYTEQIFADGAFTFTVNAAEGIEITLTPKWGTYSHDATLHNGELITATGSQPSNTQTPENSVTAEPSAEPTAPTTPTTPSSTPKDSTTITPEPSATNQTPTQPELTDTELTPAPEDATTPKDTDKTE